MDSLDYYVLALAVLEGDRDARAVLADLLEERNERGLAIWARRCKATQVRRLDFAIMLLPCEETIKLGGEFVTQCQMLTGANAFSSIERDGGAINRELLGALESWSENVDFLEAFQAWLAERHPSESFDKDRERLRNMARAVIVPGNLSSSAARDSFDQQIAVRRAMNLLIDAMECAHRRRLYADQSASRQLRDWELQANSRIRKLARIMDRACMVASRQDESLKDQGVAWQVQQVKAAYGRLLQNHQPSASDS